MAGLTLGWHVFRFLTESMFLATHGLMWTTVVVQLFVLLSGSSVLLHVLSRPAWLARRETICIACNAVYASVTVLKIFHLVPRLPNENNYLFKHFLLTCADAVFAQVGA